MWALFILFEGQKMKNKKTKKNTKQRTLGDILDDSQTHPLKDVHMGLFGSSEITQEDYDMITRENKNFAKYLKWTGVSEDDIASIANTGKVL